jgi:hypothetical protein
MQCIVTYATGMYSQLPKIISEIITFNFGYLSSGSVNKGDDLWLFFEARRDPRAKQLGKQCTVVIVIPIHQ